MAKDNGQLAPVKSGMFELKALGNVGDTLAAEGLAQIGGGTLLKLEIGSGFKGTYVGKGSYEGAPDKKTGEVKIVNTYDLEAGGERFKLLGTTSVDDAFSKLSIGDIVVVARYPDQTTGSKRKMHDIRVFATKASK